MKFSHNFCVPTATKACAKPYIKVKRGKKQSPRRKGITTVKKLIIAEKPSVARTIAQVLGVRDKQNGYIQSDEYIVSWCRGHLVTLDDASAYDPKYRYWSVTNLPIIPDIWGYHAIESGQDQLDVLKHLMNRRDVSSLVCATDAGREGELIFRTVYNYCGCTKKVERLWVSSLEESGIKKALSEMKSSEEYDSLYEAAAARQKSDWLVGINATILFSLKASSLLDSGEKSKFSVGRVQTPTLNMIVSRDAEIENFKSVPYYNIVDTFDDGEWSLSTERYDSKDKADDALRTVLKNTPVITEVEKKRCRKMPPKLYSLTDIQRDANKRFGFSASRTLEIMQSLYEKKLITYPRTDANYITEDMNGTMAGLVKKLKMKLDLQDVKTGSTSRVADNSKVTDHHALLVTDTFINSIGSASYEKDDKLILNLIAARMLVALGEPYEFDETKVTAESGDVILKGTGTQEVSKGFTVFIDRLLGGARTRKDTVFPEKVKEGYIAVDGTAEIKEGKTTPPLPYTEATLLAAMEKAGAKEMDDDVERKGIGTSATRASIIEKLISTGYVDRQQGKKNAYLRSTEKGRYLISIVTPSLSSPSMTADWENRLLDVERGKADAGKFLKDIEGFVKEIINTNKDGIKEVTRGGKVIGQCPYCGGEMVAGGMMVKCQKCEVKLYRKGKIFGDHVLTDDEVKDIIGSGARMRLTSKAGKPYTALVKADEQPYNGWVNMKLEFIDTKKKKK